MNRDSTIHIIVAMTENRLIGAAGHLPWQRPEDLRLFREMTMGNTVLMGRTTYESIGHPLAGRHNIVISSKLPETPGIDVFSTFAEGLTHALTLDHDIFCIGGRAIYQAAFPLATQLHVSWIAGNFTGDAYFPDFDLACWNETDKSSHDGFTRISYERKQ